MTETDAQKAAKAKAAEKAKAEKAKQAEFEAAAKVEEDAKKLAEAADKKEDKPANFSDSVIAEKLKHGGSPAAKAAESEDYLLKQKLYQQAGLSAPEVLATADKADKK